MHILQKYERMIDTFINASITPELFTKSISIPEDATPFGDIPVYYVGKFRYTPEITYESGILKLFFCGTHFRLVGADAGVVENLRNSTDPVPLLSGSVVRQEKLQTWSRGPSTWINIVQFITLEFSLANGPQTLTFTPFDKQGV